MGLHVHRMIEIDPVVCPRFGGHTGAWFSSPLLIERD